MKKSNNQGSITIEAAVVLPLFVLVLIAIASLMQMIRANSVINYTSYSAGKELALYSYGENLVTDIPDPLVKNLVNKVMGQGYAYNRIQSAVDKRDDLEKLFVGGSDNISLFRTSVKANGKKDDIVDIAVTYKLRPLCNVFGIGNYDMISRARLHPWTGYSYDNSAGITDEDRIVYITENGSVYHLTKDCSYLDLTIIETSSDEVSSLTNQYGKSYTPCEVCMKGKSNNSLLFVTASGSKYHSSLTCSGLKRTIIAISIKDVGDKKACSRCGKTH